MASQRRWPISRFVRDDSSIRGRPLRRARSRTRFPKRFPHLSTRGDVQRREEEKPRSAGVLQSSSSGLEPSTPSLPSPRPISTTVFSTGDPDLLSRSRIFARRRSHASPDMPRAAASPSTSTRPAWPRSRTRQPWTRSVPVVGDGDACVCAYFATFVSASEKR